MKALWGEPEETLLREIRDGRQSTEENWPNEVSALFRPERLFLVDMDTGKVWSMPMDVWDNDLSAEQNWREDGRDLSDSLETFIDSLTSESPF